MAFNISEHKQVKNFLVILTFILLGVVVLSVVSFYKENADMTSKQSNVSTGTHTDQSDRGGSGIPEGMPLVLTKNVPTEYNQDTTPKISDEPLEIRLVLLPAHPEP